MARRLLLIDDSEQWTKMVARMAALLGFAVERCNDPMLALDAFVAVKPDVVMLDMCMPEKDGIEVLNEILLTDIPAKVVLTSGYGAAFLGLANDAAKFHGRTDVSTLSKPFRASDLTEVLSSG
jgi:DNA-binding NtrC family response regulator